MNSDDEMEEGGEESDENESSEDEETTAKDGGKKDLLASDSDLEMMEKELKSSHELKEEMLQKKISRLEEVAIWPKP